MTPGQTILIVDDDAAISKGVCIRLQSAGYQTAVCRDGRNGLLIATTRRPDAIILDVRLPDMNAIEFMRRLQEDPAIREIPVIALSGAEDQRAAALEAGAQVFLLKPYERESLLTAVRHAVRPQGGS